MVWDARLAKPGRSKVSLSQPVLYLTMGFQVTRHQVHITLRAEDPLAESLTVSNTLSHNPEAVGLRRVSPYCTIWLARHTHHIYHVGAHPRPAKQIRQDDEHLLYPCFCVDAMSLSSEYKYANIC